MPDGAVALWGGSELERTKAIVSDRDLVPGQVQNAQDHLGKHSILFGDEHRSGSSGVYGVAATG
jgi:hypothetical protein